MIRSILVGVDGSPWSDRALEWSLRWAKASQAMVVGLGIIDAPSIQGGTAVPMGGGAFKDKIDARHVAEARDKVDQFLERFTLRCTEAGVPSKLLEQEGEPSQQILQEAQRYDLVVLGQETHYRFATQQSADDTLIEVLQHTPRPVVVIPKDLPESNRIVVAYDGSLQSARALASLQATGLARQSEVHVLSLGEDHVEAARIGDRAIDFLGFHGIRATRHVASRGSSVGETLIQQAANLDAGLLAMGCFGKSAWKEFFLGSVTRTVLQQSSVPLFLFH
jgi:nucleotide-binding universal stress UspA family protein